MAEYRNAWEDPNVVAALKQRGSGHIYLICCFDCGNYGYYNEGSHFTCSVDGCDWSCSGEELDALIDNGEAITLDDYTDMQVRPDLFDGEDDFESSPNNYDANDGTEGSG